MNIAVVDDVEKDQRELLRQLDAYAKRKVLLFTFQCFSDGGQFLEAYRPGAFDLLFLDVYMERVGGMDVAKEIRKRGDDLPIIFTTISPEYALDGFRVRAFDYLLKPFSAEQLEETLGLCLERLAARPQSIELQSRQIKVRIPLKDIDYADYRNHYCQIHRAEGMSRFYLPFQELAEELLRYPQFLCCSRNCIVNLERVTTIGELGFCLGSGEIVPISRNRMTEAKQRYADYLFEKLG